MDRFLLDTDIIGSANDELGTIQTAIQTISSEFSSLETTDESGEGFNFDSVKSKISSNIDACSVKVENTIKLITKVIEEHTYLQNNFKYGVPYQEPGETETPPAETPVETTTTDTERHSHHRTTTPTPTSEDFRKLDVKVAAVSYATAVVDKLSADSQTLFKREDFTYDSQSAYAMIGNRYVIACDKSYGNVGDVIAFIQKDGTSIECVIGAVTDSEEVKDKVRFFVNPEKWTAEKELTFTKNLANNTVAVYNRGNVDVLTKKLSFSTNASTSTTNTTSAVNQNNSQTNNQNTNAETSNDGVNSVTQSEKPVTAIDTETGETVYAKNSTSENANDVEQNAEKA